MLKKIRERVLTNDGNMILYAEDIDTLDNDQFAAIRHDSFGASDSSRVLGVNPFPNGSKEHLYEEKLNRISNDEIGKKASVRMGRDLEPLIIEKLEAAVGIPVYKPTDMYLNTVSGQSVNFDGVSWHKETNQFIPREIKTVSFFGDKYYKFDKAVNLDENPKDVIFHPFVSADKADYKIDDISMLVQYNADLAGVPAYYYTQLQQQMDILGSTFGTITVMNTKNWTLYEFTIERSDEIIEYLRKECMFLYMKLRSARNKKDGE